MAKPLSEQLADLSISPRKPKMPSLPRRKLTALGSGVPDTGRLMRGFDYLEFLATTSRADRSTKLASSKIPTLFPPTSQNIWPDADASRRRLGVGGCH